MAISSNSDKWNSYTAHVLKWEGKTSSDQRDTASKCFPGGIHTNKGITYCTFKAMASKLGILPVTHARFIALTDYEVGLFIYEFYKAVNGDKLPDNVALAMTEAAWGSGPVRAWQHLKDALKDLGKIAKTNSQAIQMAAQVPEKKLFAAYFARRYNYVINTLGGSATYAMYRKGWMNRLNAFKKLFDPAMAIFTFGFFF